MAEKRIRQLPPLRVDEALELQLLRLASVDDRSLSEYIRLVLERHVFGHARSVSGDSVDVNPERA